MEVTVIRHGTAEDRARTDADRALTAVGRIEAERAGDRVVAIGGAPVDSIISSPYLRARQTAELVAERLGFRDEVSIDDALCPEAPPAGVRELLARLTGRRHVILVAHEPILSAICELLLGIPVSALGRAEVLSMGSSSPHSFHPSDFELRFRS
jgi:phosphohistidine phosphatase